MSQLVNPKLETSMEGCTSESAKGEDRAKVVTAAQDGAKDVQYGWSRRACRAGGQPIGELMQQALAYPNLISLAAGFVDNGTLPLEETSQAFKAFEKDPHSLARALQYGSVSGDGRLRKAILDFSMRGFDHEIEISQMMLTSGSNQLLHLVAEAIVDPGDIVLTAAPTYFVFLGVLKNLEADTLSVESDEGGMTPEALDRRLGEIDSAGQLHRVKAVYLIPDFDNPASTSISEVRRKEIASVIERWRARGAKMLLLADYAYQELAFDGERLAPWRSLVPESDHYTIELGTFSKSFSPGVRIGWGIFPKWMMETMQSIKANIDFGSPHFNQLLMLHVLESGLLLDHLPVIRSAYQVKRDAMVDACQEFISEIPGASWGEPKGGLYVWLRLPESIPTGAGSPFFDAAIASGVLYVPGAYCFPERGAQVEHNSMRLTFGVQTPERIREGIRLIAVAAKSLLSKSSS